MFLVSTCCCVLAVKIKTLSEKKTLLLFQGGSNQSCIDLWAKNKEFKKKKKKKKTQQNLHKTDQKNSK